MVDHPWQQQKKLSRGSWPKARTGVDVAIAGRRFKWSHTGLIVAITPSYSVGAGDKICHQIEAAGVDEARFAECGDLLGPPRTRSSFVWTRSLQGLFHFF
jgi:hypothetical protein